MAERRTPFAEVLEMFVFWLFEAVLRVREPNQDMMFVWEMYLNIIALFT